jgi:hypothetical protein
MRYTGLTRLLGKAVEISFSMARGAGGRSISPNFTYYPAVDETISPAFQIVGLIDRAALYFQCCLWDNGSTSSIAFDDDNWEKLIRVGTKKIQRLFHECRASPLAMNSRNQTLLHLVASTVSGIGFLSVLHILLLIHNMQATKFNTMENVRDIPWKPLICLFNTLIGFGVPSMAYDIDGT